MKLTDKIVREAVHPGGKSYVVLWHSELRGFGLRIMPSGIKTYIYVYRFRGRQKKVTIGRHPELTLYQALKIASNIRLRLDSGDDPYKEQTVTGRDTMGELLDEFLTREAVNKRSGKLMAWRLERWIRPAFGTRKVSSIRREEVERLYRTIGERGRAHANRVLSLLARVLECGKTWGYLDEAAPNPARRIERFQEKPRNRWLKPDELRRILVAASQDEDVYVRYGILLYLLTGLRNRELMRRRWDEVDWDEKIMLVPDNKSSRPYVVHLSDLAIAVLRDMPRIQGNPYLFPNVDTGVPMTQFSRTGWKRVRTRAGILDVTVHDLRRTFSTLLASRGVPIKVIAGALNQTSHSITDTVYAHLTNDPLREAFQEPAEILKSILHDDHQK